MPNYKIKKRQAPLGLSLFIFYGGGHGTRTHMGVNPAVFKTAALPVRLTLPGEPPAAIKRPILRINLYYQLLILACVKLEKITLA